MKGTDIAIIGLGGLALYALMSRKSTEGGTPGGGVNLSLGGLVPNITMPESIGGDSGGEFAGIFGAMTDIFGFIKNVNDIYDTGKGIIEEPVKVIEGAGEIIDEATDKDKNIIDAVKDAIKDALGIDDGDGGDDKAESPTPVGQPGPDSEYDISNKGAWEWFNERPDWFQTAAGTVGLAGGGYAALKLAPTVVNKFLVPTAKTIAPKLIPGAAALTPIAGGFAAMGIGKAVKPEWNWNPFTKEFWGFGEQGWVNQYWGEDSQKNEGETPTPLGQPGPDSEKDLSWYKVFEVSGQE